MIVMVVWLPLNLVVAIGVTFAGVVFSKQSFLNILQKFWFFMRIFVEAVLVAVVVGWLGSFFT